MVKYFELKKLFPRRRVKTFILIILVIYVILVLIIGEVFFSASRHRDYPVDPNDFDASKIELNQENKTIVLWHKSIQSEKIVFIVHGHSDNSGYMFDRYVPIFIGLGYDILTIDLRNHGLSDDIKPVTFGLYEAKDVELGLKWINNNTDYEEILLFGTSMGAVAALLAIDNINTKINGLILDSPYINLENTMRLSLNKHKVPSFLFYHPVKFYLNIRFNSHGLDINDFPDLISVLQNNSDEIPILVLYGTSDVEVSELDYKAITDQVSNITIVPIIDGEHSRLYLHDNFKSAMEEWLI